MTRRARFWTTTLALLLWQLGGVVLAPVMGATPAGYAAAGKAAQEVCPGHYHDSQGSTVQKTAGERLSASTAPETKHPCGGCPECQCHGPPTGMAFVSPAPPAVPSHPPAPSPDLDAGRAGGSPSNPFRPPIV